MIKCNVTLCGKIFFSAQEKTSKDGQKFLSFGVSIPMKGKDESVTELRINVSTQGTQAEAGNYISGRRVTVVGVMYVKKIENNVYYNLRATSPIQFNETTDPDNLSGSIEFTGKIGSKGVKDLKSKKGNDFQVFDAFTHDSEGEKQGFYWVHFTNFSPIHEDFFKAGEYVEVNGELELDVFRSEARINCRATNIKKHEFVQTGNGAQQQGQA